MAIRSMTSAVAGLRAQQTAMDVIGNNIANVNTAGFKASQTTFSDMFYQTINGGGTQVDPSQVGYGAQVANVSKNMSKSGYTQTDNATDVYLDGEGFFALGSQTDCSTSGSIYYSRLGKFSTPNGYLCDASGNYVLDDKKKAVQLVSDAATTVTLHPASGADVTITNANYGQLMNISINTDGTITASIDNVTGTLQSVPASGGTASNMHIGFVTFNNPSGLSEAGNSYFTSTQSSGTPNFMVAGTNNSTAMRAGKLEQSNVDLASEFTSMIVTQRGYQANARVITVSDSMLEELVNLKRS
jgi:flagellar hook protein FlgE